MTCDLGNDCEENNKNDFKDVLSYSHVFVPLQESEKTDTAFEKRASGSSNDSTDAQWVLLKLEYAEPSAAVKLVVE